MNTVPEKFEINLDGLTYTVERSMTDNNIYKLYNPHGTYFISKDFYGIWVELASKKGSASISLSQIGQKIEDLFNSVSSL